MKNALSLFFLKKLILSSRSGSLMRRISILSFAAVTLSVSIFLIVLFVMNGMNKGIQNRIVSLDANITAYFADNQPIQVKDNPLYRGLRFDAYDLILRTVDGQFRGSQAVGYSQSDFMFWENKLLELQKKDAFAFDTSPVELEKNEIAIGVDVARSLGLLVGDQITLIPIETLLLSQMETPIYEKVTVKKIISTDLPDIDANVIYFNREKSLTAFQKSLSRVSGYHFWLTDKDQLDSALEALAPYPFSRLETWKQKNSDLFFALFMEKTMIGIFLGLAGLIASTSVLTVLALIMSQKRADIAIIKTLGLSDKQTLLLFTKIGLWLSLSAVGVGSLIGITVSLYLEKYPLQVLPHIYYDASIPATVDFSFALIVILVSTVLAILGCYWPAKATLGIQPAILLKQKS